MSSMNAGLLGWSGGSGDRGACCGDELEDERCAPALPVELALCSGPVNDDRTGTADEDAAAAVAVDEDAAAGPSISMLVACELAFAAAAAAAAPAACPLVRASCLVAWWECTCGDEAEAEGAAALSAGGEIDADDAPWDMGAVTTLLCVRWATFCTTE